MVLMEPNTFTNGASVLNPYYKCSQVDTFNRDLCFNIMFFSERITMNGMNMTET